MTIKWQNLRPWDGSQNKAFEELCCQLASRESEPLSANAEFIRKAAPDAGVECYWQYSNSDEWGFQAKFFLNPSEIDWSQIDKSVKTALEKHPCLTRYTVCLPMDRPDARVSGRESCLEKWNKRVEKWSKWAQGRGVSVQFDYWGEHEVFTRLSRKEHCGRFFFWFNKEQLSQRWFEEHLDEVIANAGPRYSPELNVDLPIVQLFDGLGRTKDFFNRIKRLYGQIRRAYSKARSSKADEVAKNEFTELQKNLDPLLSILGTIDTIGTHQIDFDRTAALSQDAREKVWKCIQVLERAAEEEKKRYAVSEDQTGLSGEEPRHNHPRDFNYERHYLYELIQELNALEHFAHDDPATLANIPALLLVGKAGIGKTHLFCDVAKYRIHKNLPTVLLLGEQFGKSADPWSQIIKQLHLPCQNRDEFLGALEAAAQARDSKAIILVDALNEGEGKTIWRSYLAGMLAVLTRYPHLAIAVSVRTSYEQTIIPDRLVPDKLVREVHYGFAQHEYEATRIFFDFFGIELPSVPLLVPDFENPLFLKIFCKGLNNHGLTRVPTGLQGITAIFRFFVKSVTKKLAHPRALDFDEKQNIVEKALEKTAELMAERKRTWLPREEVQAVVNILLPRQGYEESLFRNLISEGLLAEDMFPSERKEGEWIEGIRFPYERFADHSIAQYLIGRHLDMENPSEAFGKNGPLGVLVESESGVCRNLGIIEAFCIQLPECTGKEFSEIVPHCADFQPVKEAFIESLIWRDPRAITDATLNYINDVIKEENNHEHFLDALLTIASSPDHPYNADFLYRHLMRFELAERDAWWSVFLHYQHGRHGAVGRMVDWAWSVGDKSHIDDEPIRLCATALVWFLTTANRFLRDRATKALVSLLTDRIHILRKIISRFLKVNDPYILERLFAVAYGCAMRSDDSKAIEALARDTYEWVFKSGQPPPHILLRDYARGVIELALYRGIEMNIELSKVRPPYKSKWPSEIPSEEDLKSKYYEDRDYLGIWFSVMGFGDFARYVIGTNSGLFEWTSRPLGAPKKPTNRQIYKSFVSGLNAEQREKWDKLRTAVIDISSVLIALRESPNVFAESEKNGKEPNITEETQSDTKKLEEEFLKTLAAEQVRLYQEVVVPYLSSPGKDEDRFDLSIAQRWIFQRVIDLGWTPEFFRRFDANIDRRFRDAHKAERIGKKYQWMALHEFLARVSDNFEFKGDLWSDEPQTYDGPWQLWLRDIDPSCLPYRREREESELAQGWWCPVEYTDWEAEAADGTSWLKNAKNLPQVQLLIQVANPLDHKKWLALEGFYEWEEPIPIEEERYEVPRRQIWYILKSYIAKKADADRLFVWLKKQNFMGRWMPEPFDFYEVFLGEYPWAMSFGKEYSEGWTRGRDGRIPCPVIVTCASYVWEGNGFDCSIDNTISMNLPSSWLIGKMNLHWSRKESVFVSDDGEVIAFDPSVDKAGPTTLLISESTLLEFLENNGYEIFWTLLGEKNIIGGDYLPSDWKGRLELSGACRLQSGKVKCFITNRFIQPDSDGK